jgi:hypothetical protein
MIPMGWLEQDSQRMGRESRRLKRRLKLQQKHPRRNARRKNGRSLWIGVGGRPGGRGERKAHIWLAQPSACRAFRKRQAVTFPKQPSTD